MADTKKASEEKPDAAAVDATPASVPTESKVKDAPVPDTSADDKQAEKQSEQTTTPSKEEAKVNPEDAKETSSTADIIDAEKPAETPGMDLSKKRLLSEISGGLDEGKPETAS